MTKESLLLLQKIDCNCNDCKFMVRDAETRRLSIQGHDDSQLNLFNIRKLKMLEAALKWKERGQMKKHDLLMKQRDEMVYEFDSSAATLHFGHCEKFDKSVSFIPNICQLDTQECFKHRRDAI